MRAKYKSIKYKDAQVQTIRPNDTSAMDDNKYARSAQKTKHRAAVSKVHCVVHLLVSFANVRC